MPILFVMPTLSFRLDNSSPSLMFIPLWYVFRQQCYSLAVYLVEKFAFCPELCWRWCVAVQRYCLQAEPAGGFLPRLNSSWDMEKHVACARQNVAIVPCPVTELQRTAAGNWIWSNFSSPSLFWTARNLLFHSLSVLGELYFVERGGVQEDLTWKVIILYAAFLTLAHKCSLFLLLSELCLCFVLKALWKSDTFPQRSGQRKKSQWNERCCCFNALTDKSWGFWAYALA